MVDIKINTDVIKDIRLMIFDKDGTLMDLYNYWSQMVGYRVELANKKFGLGESEKKKVMYDMGVDLENHRLKSDGPVGLKKREIVMQAMMDSLNSLGFPITQDICCEIFKEADRMSLDHLAEIIKPVDGMHRLIDTLHKKGCRIAVATTDKTERATLALRFLKISDKVDIVVGEDMVKKYKPYPDMVNLILKLSSIDQNHAVIVGDAITDVEMGINAGLKAAVAVCSGLTPKKDLLNKTRYVIDDISHIMVI